MLTQKKIKAVVPSNEFSKEMISWLANDSERLAASFEKKFPRARNKFNVELKNVNGLTRLVVLNSDGEFKFFPGYSEKSYKNVLTWQTARLLGCPTS